jgi:predicted Zn-dependent protease
MGISGAMAAMSGYTRELEAEADRVGMQVMAAAGYDPGEALALFDHMITEIEQEGLEEPFFFGSHPKVRQRIENLQNLSDLGYINKGSRIKNSEIFLAKLDKLFLDNAGLDIRQGRFQAARRSVEKYLRIKPDDTRAYFLLGEIFRQRGQVDDATKAIKYYNQAIFLDPTYADPHKAIGLIHYKKGKHTLAKKFFEACLQLSPDSPDKAYIQAYLKQFEQNGEG